MRTNIILILGFLAVVLAITNPKIEAHKDAVKTKFFIEGEYFLEPNISLDEHIDRLINIENYGLFSVTKVTWEDREGGIGIGVFGNVFFYKHIDEF